MVGNRAVRYAVVYVPFCDYSYVFIGYGLIIDNIIELYNLFNHSDIMQSE